MIASELNHAHQIVTSLNKIFKSYVRGNAVHAQTKTGTYVALDGRELDMDDFLLGGPYMSWEGFLFFCHDFNITPRRDGKVRLSEGGGRRAGGAKRRSCTS